jgi:hypothetical protein
MPTLRAERVTELEELLRDQRFDRRRVESELVVGQRVEADGQGDQALAGARRGVEHHVVAGEDFEDRLLLCRIELDAQLLGVGEELLEQAVAIEPLAAGWQASFERRGRLLGC